MVRPLATELQTRNARCALRQALRACRGARLARRHLWGVPVRPRPPRRRRAGAGGTAECEGGTFESDRITAYVYDGNDRLLTETTDDDDNNEDRHTVYDWDADDEGTNDSTTQLGKTVFIGLDDQGAKEKVVTQAYNARGRLAAFAVDDGGDGTVESEIEYLYDEDGLRVRQILAENGVQQEVRDFIFDKQNPTGYAQAVEELKDGQPDKAYTVGLDVIAQAVWDAVAGAAKPPAFFVYDGHGSVRQLADKLGEVVKIALDDLGKDVLKADYEAYGDAINFTVASAVTTLLYSGEFTDSANGMQYLRARWYVSASGRFTRADSFQGSAQIPQSLHKYLYAHADPLSFDDPTGNSILAVLLFTIIFTAIVGSILHVAASSAEQDLMAASNNLQASVWNIPEDFDAERLAYLDPEMREANLEFAGRLSNANNLVAFQSTRAKANFIDMINVSMAAAPLGGGPVRAAPRFMMGWHPGKADHLADILRGGANVFASGKYDAVSTHRTLSTLMGRTVNSRSCQTSRVYEARGPDSWISGSDGAPPMETS